MVHNIFQINLNLLRKGKTRRSKLWTRSGGGAVQQTLAESKTRKMLAP